MVESAKRSETTQRPSAKAGRTVRRRWSARAALCSRVSAMGDQRPASPVVSRRRISSAPREPPGSRVSSTSSPAARRAAASRRAWVDLPAPSPPSSVMNRPGSAKTPVSASDQVFGGGDHAAEGAELLHGGGGDQRYLHGR